MPDAGPRPAFPGPKAFVSDIRLANAAVKRRPVPRGDTTFSLVRTWRARHDVLELLLEGYYKYGPIYGIKIMHDRSVFMIGPEANHFVLVSGRENFVWRHGRFGDLITLIGDGLLTTDGDYHDTSRAIMMPSFHRDRVAASVETMVAEAEAAGDRLKPGETIDIFHWTRELAMRIAMQALFGFDPDSARAGETATHFEEGLSFHGAEFVAQLLVGPCTPYAKLKRSRAALERTIGEEIAARRRSGSRSRRRARLAAGCNGRDWRRAQRQAGPRPRTDAALRRPRHDDLDDHLHGLRARAESGLDAEARQPLDAVMGPSAAPSTEQLFGELPLLSQAVDETLRLYPPAWIGPRAPSPTSSSSASRCRPGCRSLTPRGSATTCPTSGRARVSSGPSASSPRTGRSCRAAPTCRSGWGRESASASASATRRCTRSRQRCCGASSSACPRARRQIEQSPTLSPKGGLPVRLHARS